jgi:molecular chaperone GrpE
MADKTTEHNPAEDEAPTMADQLKAAIAERDQFKDKWARSVADLDNFRKRIYREMEEERKYSALPVLKSLLPAFDGLDRAVAAAAQSKDFDGLLNGVQMTIKQLETALNGHGAKAIKALGEKFDPHLHEAISQAPTSDHPPMTVLNDVERGYTLHDRVIRPSKVIVSIAPPEKAG